MVTLAVAPLTPLLTALVWNPSSKDGDGPSRYVKFTGPVTREHEKYRVVHTLGFMVHTGDTKWSIGIYLPL